MIPFGDPSASYQAHKSDIDQAIKRVLDSGWYVLGTEVDAFEKEFVSLARSVYITNDKRFDIKNKINKIFSSDIMEVKSYEKY